MTIEVTCTQCDARLRVPDEARGEQAKCPHCENVFDVIDGPIEPPVDLAEPPAVPPRPPRPTSDPFAETTPGPSPFGSSAEQDVNPYAAPLSEPPEPDRTLGEMQLGQLDAGTAVKIAWEMLKANLPTLLLANGAFLLASIIMSSLSESVAQQNPGLQFVLSTLSTAAQWFLSIGLTLINLNVARGKPADIGMMFSGGPWFVRVAIGTIIYSLMLFLTVWFFVVPAIYLASKFWAYHCFIIDRDCGVMEAFGLAGEFAEGNKMQAVVLMVLTLVIVIAGVLALCVGLFFAMPVVSMMWVIAYLMITRQPIQRPTA